MLLPPKSPETPVVAVMSSGLALMYPAFTEHELTSLTATTQV